MELDPKYIDVIIQRFENYTKIKAEKINQIYLKKSAKKKLPILKGLEDKWQDQKNIKQILIK